jgi:hypothetical protein
MTCGLAWRCSLLLLSRDQCPDKGQVIITIFFFSSFLSSPQCLYAWFPIPSVWKGPAFSALPILSVGERMTNA